MFSIYYVSNGITFEIRYIILQNVRGCWDSYKKWCLQNFMKICRGLKNMRSWSRISFRTKTRDKLDTMCSTPCSKKDSLERNETLALWWFYVGSPPAGQYRDNGIAETLTNFWH